MALSRHEALMLAGLEKQSTAASPRLSRRLASRRGHRLRDRLERALVAFGWVLVGMGLVLLLSFPGVPSFVGFAFVLMVLGVLCATTTRLVRHVPALARQGDDPPRE